MYAHFTRPRLVYFNQAAVLAGELWPTGCCAPPPWLQLAAVSGICVSSLLQAMPASVVLHHLYSRAPQSLQSPHTRSRFTPAQYSLWLDQHTSEDVLRFIRSALTACQTKAEHEPGFDEVFPVMMKLCKAAS